MYVKVMSTRHTVLGTLRRGLVYRIDETDRRGAELMAAHGAGEAPALVKISAAQAKKAAPVVLGPQNEGTGAAAAEGEPGDAGK